MWPDTHTHFIGVLQWSDCTYLTCHTDLLEPQVADLRACLGKSKHVFGLVALQNSL